ncbi:MAG: hypothetical protein L0Z50_20395 [Verrucomicrobiales bacterium]|nr:hypothetical protein [Verrucomicrobiales bacterium]
MGYSDGLVEVWQWKERKLTATFDGHSTGVHRILFLSDHLRLASLSSEGGDIHIWNLRDGSKVASLSGQLSAFNHLAESRDGRRIAAGGNDGTITLWDLDNYQEVARLRGHRDYVFALAFLPDGNTLTSVSRESMRVWRAAPFSETIQK